eukprot:363338-Chlamydomonas_euryale.AAC.3
MDRRRMRVRQIVPCCLLHACAAATGLASPPARARRASPSSRAGWHDAMPATRLTARRTSVDHVHAPPELVRQRGAPAARPEAPLRQAVAEEHELGSCAEEVHRRHRRR